MSREWRSVEPFVFVVADRRDFISDEEIEQRIARWADE
jgi:hypothetical protein